MTIVLDGKATSAKKKAVSEKVTKLIELNKGKIEKEEDWGVKELAYEIKKSTSGNFLYFVLELDPNSVKAISTKLEQEGEVIRFLLVRNEE